MRHYELQVAHEVQAATAPVKPREMPRVSGTASTATAAPNGERPERRGAEVRSPVPDSPALNEWYHHYQATISPVSARLGPLLGPLRANVPDPAARGGCPAARRAVQDLMADGTALHPPDPLLERELVAGFAWLVQMLESCEREDWQVMHRDRELAEGSMALVQRLLRAHGLEP
jgi:hypothetical protein